MYSSQKKKPDAWKTQNVPTLQLSEKSLKFCCRASEGGLPVTGNIGTVFLNWSMPCPQRS